MDCKGQIEALKNLEAIAYGYSNNGEALGMDCSDFEQLMVDVAESFTNLIARAESAEARAEKAERERDAAVELVGWIYYESCVSVEHDAGENLDWLKTKIEEWHRKKDK